jgi:prepilin-type N-terminal cleavage/methylation domain-containing protein
MAHRSGFTLVELSIVLVIIGLVLGGITVGRDLIEAGRIRQQISQIEQFKVAASTFRNKYGGIPGDLKADVAAGFGMSARSGNPGDGDGDGWIGACSTFQPDYFGCETVLFWNDLSFANLIPGSFTMPSTSGFISVDQQDLGKYLPAGTIGNQTHITAFSLPPEWFELANLPMCNKSFCFSLAPIFLADDLAGLLTAGMPGNHFGITPFQALAIDSKMDDGKPFTGTVAGGSTMYPPVFTSPALYEGPSNDLCLSMAGTGSSVEDFTYAVSGPYRNQLECSMNFSGQ